MKKIFIIIVILVLIAGVLYFLIWRAKPVVRPVVPSTGPEGELPPEGGPASPLPVVDPIVLLKQELTNQARAFIERYASFSSDADFANLEDLLPLMSERLANETRNYIAAERAKPKTAVFYGLTSRVLSIEIKDFVLDVSAIFSASCQQQETKGQTSAILYKTVNLKMIFENNSWKVDEIRFE